MRRPRRVRPPGGGGAAAPQPIPIGAQTTTLRHRQPKAHGRRDCREKLLHPLCIHFSYPTRRPWARWSKIGFSNNFGAGAPASGLTDSHQFCREIAACPENSHLAQAAAGLGVSLRTPEREIARPATSPSCNNSTLPRPAVRPEWDSDECVAQAPKIRSWFHYQRLVSPEMRPPVSLFEFSCLLGTQRPGRCDAI